MNDKVAWIGAITGCIGTLLALLSLYISWERYRAERDKPVKEAQRNLRYQVRDEARELERLISASAHAASGKEELLDLIEYKDTAATDFLKWGQDGAGRFATAAVPNAARQAFSVLMEWEKAAAGYVHAQERYSDAERRGSHEPGGDLERRREVAASRLLRTTKPASEAVAAVVNVLDAEDKAP